MNSADNPASAPAETQAATGAIKDKAAWRFVWLLSGSKMAQILVTSITVSFVGIVGGDLAGDAAYGTVPMMVVLLSAGLITLPASLLLARFGHRRNYVLSNLTGSAGSLAVALAIPGTAFPCYALDASPSGSITHSPSITVSPPPERSAIPKRVKRYRPCWWAASWRRSWVR